MHGAERVVVVIRPGHLAVIFTVFFLLVASFAFKVAESTTAAWYDPAISLGVYQTTMIGGVLILAGLFIAASILPHGVRGGPSGMLAWGDRDGTRSRLPSHRMTRAERAARAVDERWTVEDILDDPEFDDPSRPNLRRAEDAAAVSATLSRLRLGASESAAGTLMDRLSRIQARDSAISVSESRGRGDSLGRLATEMRPLLRAAKRAGLDVPEIRRLVYEASSGREGDLAYRVRLAEQMKGTLEAALSQRAATELETLLRDIERAKVLTEQVHGAELTAAEAVAFLDTGHYAAAFDRAERARELFEQRRSPTLPPMDWSRTPSSFAAFAGPAFMAATYVAIAAMLLPGVGGFLETNFALNTGVILFLSYGWFGLVLYAFLSIVVASHPSPPRPRPVADDLFDEF